MQLDRELIFDENPKPKYLWCMHCCRVYEYGQFRLVDGSQMCPYSDCNGDTVLDAWGWEDLRRNAPDYYPETPVVGESYMMP